MVTDDLYTIVGIFLSRSQILLLPALIESSFNSEEALTELNFVDVVNILSKRRLIFLPLGATKSNLSENVLRSEAGLSQYIFTGDSLIKNTKVITPYPSGSIEKYREITLPCLKSIPKGYKVMPGHGESFLIGEINL